MIKIYGFDIEENAGYISLPDLFPYVSHDKRHRICALRTPDDARQVLVGDLLIRSVACRYLGMKNIDIQFQVNEYGKPYLSGFNGHHFSLSHSGKWVVCAYSEQVVGVDIEEIGPVDMDIAFEYFLPKEIEYIVRKPLQARDAAFYDIWTYKESYTKALGTGLSKDLKSFSVSQINGNTAVICEPTYDKAFLRQYCVNDKYRLSVCAFNDDFSEDVEIVNIPWILNILKNKD